MKKQTLVYAVMTTLISMQSGAFAAELPDEAAKTPTAEHAIHGSKCAQKASATEVEKCYGIAKGGKNDCATKRGNGCAGSIKQDKDAEAWIFVPKDTCDRISGGSTTEPK